MNEAEMVLTSILSCDRAALYTRAKSRLDKKQAKALSSIFKRRINGEPLQYILGKTEFMGLEFGVNRRVLIPRPETEILVETAVRYAARKPAGRILDMCTGSGCIAISLAKALKDAAIDAADVSGEALQVARRNARAHKAGVRFIRADLFDSPSLVKGSYDMLVCNPPYIPRLDIAGLQPEVRHEPFCALDGGDDGLAFFRRVSRLSSAYLKDKGMLIMEMGYKQAAQVKKIFKNDGFFDIIEVIKDYARIDRILVAEKRELHG
ncbi:MAG: peptide chain release factor N(5)-glutamine methyltransferase [Candidatus Omnitrophica bacterium]|nr:peptide chain release factor N(5)-glutamine methyltransferase [Candidatus Omnitrophota bacterium]